MVDALSSSEGALPNLASADKRRGLAAIAWLVALAAALLAFFLLRYPVRGFELPMGPDAPVYMWWTNLARIDGLSVANWRPGAPALALMLGGTLGLSQLEVFAGMGAVFGTAIGLAATALVRADRVRRPLWVVLATGVLAGTYTVHLAGGYFGNIVFAGLFLAALALLAADSPSASGGPITRRAAAGAVLLGAGGLAHPPFFVLGVVVLLVALPFVAREQRAGIRFAALGGAALTGAGLLSMFSGPRPLQVDTSADSFMRRASLDAELKSQYLTRVRLHSASYVPYILLPLAWFGRREMRGTARRLLGSWAVVCLVALVVSLVVAVVPAVRLAAFVYALPILAGLGLARALRTNPSRTLGVAIVAVLAGAMLLGAALIWSRERPYATLSDISQIRAAGDVAAHLPAGTPLVFVVDAADGAAAMFAVTNAGNLIRAYVPPERIPDVHLFVGESQDFLAGVPTITGSPQHDALSRLYLDDMAHTGVTAESSQVFLLDAFNLPGRIETAQPGVDLIGGSPAAGRLPSPWRLVFAGAASFMLLGVAGYGWARAVTRDSVPALALAPSFGAAGLIVAGVVLDRLGLRLSGAVPAVATVAVGLCGYLFAYLQRSERKPRMESSPQV